MDHLRKELLFGDDDPLFPASEQRSGPARQLVVVGLSRSHWRTTEPIRDVFRRGFALAGQPYFTPHSFRRTLTRFGQQTCTTPEEIKAFSQNLGHDELSTTMHSYGTVPDYRQAEVIAALTSEKRGAASNDDLRGQLQALLRKSRKWSEYLDSDTEQIDGDERRAVQGGERNRNAVIDAGACAFPRVFPLLAHPLPQIIPFSGSRHFTLSGPKAARADRQRSTLTNAPLFLSGARALMRHTKFDEEELLWEADKGF